MNVRPPRIVKVHKRKLRRILGESVGGVFGSLCDGRTYRRRLHELWSAVTCPKCLALRAEKTAPENIGGDTAAKDSTT